MSLTDADRAYIARHVAEVRARQGLPPTITDPVVLNRIAELLRSAVPRPAEPRGDDRRRARRVRPAESGALSPTAKTLTVPEAAALLGISAWLYYDRVKKGDLPALKIGRRLVVPRIAVERLLR